jgi:hypothetical protein
MGVFKIGAQYFTGYLGQDGEKQDPAPVTWETILIIFLAGENHGRLNFKQGPQTEI